MSSNFKNRSWKIGKKYSSDNSAIMTTRRPSSGPVVPNLNFTSPVGKLDKTIAFRNYDTSSLIVSHMDPTICYREYDKTIISKSYPHPASNENSTQRQYPTWKMKMRRTLKIALFFISSLSSLVLIDWTCLQIGTLI